MNKQSNNVGNTGDIAKHMAWTTLLERLTESARDLHVVAIDTHAFLAKAPLGSKTNQAIFTGQAPDELMALARLHVPHYAQWERTSVAETGDYLCYRGDAPVVRKGQRHPGPASTTGQRTRRPGAQREAPQ